MKILHIVPGLEEHANGIAVAARLIAGGQGADMADASAFVRGAADPAVYDECWVHSCWLPSVLRSRHMVVRSGVPLVCMTHACLDPLRLRFHGWKKQLVGPIERSLLRRSEKIVATCEAERAWIEAYLGRRCPKIEVMDIRRFFNLSRVEHAERAEKGDGALRLLYLGRRHPLKGIEYLEEAVRQLEARRPKSEVSLRVVSNAFGDELEKVWEWCDVLVLPTLSENFGLVIAEALERGKFAITTDGAPAWCDGEDYGGRLISLNGFRCGTKTDRTLLLRDAIEKVGGLIKENSQCIASTR